MYKHYFLHLRDYTTHDEKVYWCDSQTEVLDLIDRNPIYDIIECLKLNITHVLQDGKFVLAGE
jgi:hypothetical protein